MSQPILVVRLGAMGDVIRTLRIDCAIDFQGLIKSSIVAKASGAQRICGYHASQTREGMAAWFYSEQHRAQAEHIVDRHLELARCCGATDSVAKFHLPEGKSEGTLPDRFVLASPFAGWPSKEWPLENYSRLAKLLPVPLVVNTHPAGAPLLQGLESVSVHVSSIAGLLHATRRAAAVVGVDSGPLHIAAALGKPGVAIFGPTDPKRNGPYGGSMRVLRYARAVTSYQRSPQTDPSMLEITPSMVAEALSL
ncbi:MAG: glycosyltransferase family 9 protein [Candidatus Solibacter usitatus]|nr:glycosyltransferase family 9 protein [Candidatus Solibacter usitatus]